MSINPDSLNLPRKRIFKKQAPIWKRFLAFVLDLFVIQFVVFLPFQGVFKGLENANWQAILANPESMTIPGNMIAAIVIIVFLSLMYFTLFEYYLRQTVGMTFLGIFVEGDITLFKALVRSCFIIPSFPFYVLWIVEPLHLFFYKFRLMERWTQTNTVEVLQAY